MILEGADGGVRDHYTSKKVAQSGGPMVSLDFVHNFLGISHLQPHHPRAPKQLKSRWRSQDRAGSQEFHVEKTRKKIGNVFRTMNSISVKKLSKTV